MSQTYYYFASTLPFLNFNEKPPFSTKDFLKECQRFLCEEDFQDMTLAIAEDGSLTKGRSEALNQWVEFERIFRNEMVFFRTKDSHRDPADYLRGERYAWSYLVNVITEASKKSTPLEAEHLLDQTRWQFLGDIQQSHYFDTEYLIVYALKLKILERYQRFASQEGQKKFQQYKDVKVPQLSTS